MSNTPQRNPFAPPSPDAPKTEPLEPQRKAERDPEHGSRHGSKQSPEPNQDEPPTMEELKEVSRTTFRFGAALVLAMLSSQLPLPYTLVAPLLIIFAITMGIMALRRSWRISRRGLIVPMLIVGIGMAFLMSMTVFSKLALWSVEMEHQTCTSLAITNTAKAECQVAYEQAVQDYLESLRGVASP